MALAFPILDFDANVADEKPACRNLDAPIVLARHP
jgi:hypothetical protein